MSTGGLTRRSAAYHRSPGRPGIDQDAPRYFVYRVHDAAGEVVYVGRSCDVEARLRAHAGNGADWLPAARRLSMDGPFTWGEAVRAERAEIERLQPRGNKALTKAHGFRPLAEGGGRFRVHPSP